MSDEWLYLELPWSPTSSTCYLFLLNHTLPDDQVIFSPTETTILAIPRAYINDFTSSYKYVQLPISLKAWTHKIWTQHLLRFWEARYDKSCKLYLRESYCLSLDSMVESGALRSGGLPYDKCFQLMNLVDTKLYDNTQFFLIQRFNPWFIIYGR